MMRMNSSLRRSGSRFHSQSLASLQSRQYSKQDLMQIFELNRISISRIFELNRINHTISVDPISSKHICKKQMSELHPTTICNLRSGEINYGTKLSATTITHPLQAASVQSIIEDADGNAILLSLYNYIKIGASHDELNKLLPKGSNVIIKEPYMKLARDDSHMIRIDNPLQNFTISTLKKKNEKPKSAPINVDEQHYIAPIEIRYINDKIGRGIFATHDIPYHDLLLDERCVAYQEGTKDIANPITIDESDIKNKGIRINENDWIQQIMNIYACGSDIDKYKISLLYSGSEYESFKNKTVPSMNIFTQNELPRNINIKNIPVLSAAQINGIVKNNSFICPLNVHEYLEKKGENPKGWYWGNALFVLASFFNHSNNPNAHWQLDGKRIVVGAKEHIKKGEQIFVSYGPHTVFN